jgi:hypothetical protein
MSSVKITGGTITGITDLAVADGGTGASTAAQALINLGLTATATELVGATAATSVGINALTPGTDATRTALWDDTGTTDRRVFVLSAGAGAGVGTLTVRYIQAHDLP